ncbi:hypothetical protein JB92DRAFT_1863297 [Gautieria morchelliformis]|nr:hypothetical protein JB92DRAFT_1863297 [Gautieria morchelliformis]
MTTLMYTTSLRTSNLTVKISHLLSTSYSKQCEGTSSAGHKSATQTHNIQAPKDIDILSHPSHLTISLWGSVDGTPATADQMCASGVGRHLLKCMRRNATFLGIHDISDFCVQDGISNAETNCQNPQEGYNITTSSLPLDPITSYNIGPFAALLDQVVHRIFSYHMIRRYPLIFGPYSHCIRAEQVFFPSVAKSLCAIITRSESLTLKHQSLACMKRLRQQNAQRSPIPTQKTNVVRWEMHLNHSTTLSETG